MAAPIEWRIESLAPMGADVVAFTEKYLQMRQVEVLYVIR
jgi:hypothetical protein